MAARSGWATRPSLAASPATTQPPPRLTVVAPFFLDTHEHRVSRTRAWLAEHDPSWPAGESPDPAPWSGELGIPLDDLCTMPTTLSDQTRDALPTNCISKPRAQAICSSRGGALPTEAQLEYVARGMRNTPFVWGRDEPECEDAVFARAGSPNFFKSHPAACRPFESIGGPLPVAAGALDRLPFDEGAVTDLAGNLPRWPQTIGPPRQAPVGRRQ